MLNNIKQIKKLAKALDLLKDISGSQYPLSDEQIINILYNKNTNTANEYIRDIKELRRIEKIIKEFNDNE